MAALGWLENLALGGDVIADTAVLIGVAGRAPMSTGNVYGKGTMVLNGYAKGDMFLNGYGIGGMTLDDAYGSGTMTEAGYGKGTMDDPTDR